MNKYYSHFIINPASPRSGVPCKYRKPHGVWVEVVVYIRDGTNLAPKAFIEEDDALTTYSTCPSQGNLFFSKNFTL